MPVPVHIPRDEEVGLSEANSKRRAIFFIACAICKTDYDVRDGAWLDTFTKAGTRIQIKVCTNCYQKEVMNE